MRIRSGMANASSRGRIATRISRSASISSFTRRSISATSSPAIVSNSKSMRPASGSMLPPVTDAPGGRARSTPHSTCSAEWVRISAWRRSQSISARDGGADGGQLGPPRVCQMSSPRLRAPVTRHVPPGLGPQPARVGRLPAAPGIEDGPVKEDGVGVTSTSTTEASIVRA